jgi:protein gp37
MLRPERLEQPLLWRRPRLIFVNSMSDLFHETIPIQYIRQVFDVMRRASWHTFQVLTKRSARLACLALELPWPDNVWIGVSVENQRWICRVDDLRRVPARVRFLSCEPLLGPLEIDLTGIHWVIVGGESGHGARRMRPEWARAVRDQCLDAGVPFFFKQWGAYDEEGTRRGKHATGRRLDGQLWDESPQEPRERAEAGTSRVLKKWDRVLRQAQEERVVDSVRAELIEARVPDGTFFSTVLEKAGLAAGVRLPEHRAHDPRPDVDLADEDEVIEALAALGLDQAFVLRRVSKA